MGRYGFLSDFRRMSEIEARSRIRNLFQLFNIREFQFYDWASSYSKGCDGEIWTDAFFRTREVSRTTILIFIDEIHRLGGRAWAYVQAVGAEEETLEYLRPHAFRLIDRQGRSYVHAGRFPCYFANGAWSCFMVQRWAPEIQELGFDGIHWDTLGSIAGDYAAEQAGLWEFIKQAADLLPAFDLLQTLNFVSLAWWDAEIIRRSLCFPYAEVWSLAEEQLYYQQFQSGPLANSYGVLAHYPSQNLPNGWSESQNMLIRWAEAEQRGLSYLLLGDDLKRLRNEYFPNNVPLNEDEILSLKGASVREELASAG